MTDKYTLVTGASSGIGKAIANYCGSLGMNLILISLPGEGLESVAFTIADKYKVKTHFLETDLTQNDSPEQVYNWTRECGMDVSVLVNNAGVAGASVFETSDLKYIDARIMLNIRATVMLTRLFIPVLKKHKESFVLNIGSMAGFYPIPYKTLYSASKTFVLNFSRSVRAELQQTGVSVSVLCPNGVRTNGFTHGRIDAHGKMGHWTELTPDEVAKYGIDGMLKKKFMIIPGIINHLLYFAGIIIPSAIQVKILHKEFMKEVKATSATSKAANG